jgi:hypothetical protein
LSNCVFSNNTCSEGGFGNDIAYNSNLGSIYSTSNIENTCTTSSNPHITGSDTDIIVSLPKCDSSDNKYLVVCNTSRFCNNYKTKDECISGTENNTIDGPCVWTDNSEGGICSRKQERYPFRNESLRIEERVEDLLSRLTLEEKINEMKDETAGIERLGIAKYGWRNEGLHGIGKSGIYFIYLFNIYFIYFYLYYFFIYIIFFCDVYILLYINDNIFKIY